MLGQYTLVQVRLVYVILGQVRSC